MTKLEKARAMECFASIVEYVEQDPDPKSRDDIMEEFNCKNCDNYEYCQKLAGTLS